MITQKRKKYICNIFLDFEKNPFPLDVFLSKYFRKNKSIGSKDRRFIADSCYTIIRWLGLIDHFNSPPHCWEKRIDTFFSIHKTIDTLNQDETIPIHKRLSFPKNYFNQLCRHYPLSTVISFCLISNTRAPTTIRVNTLKISRDALFDQFKDFYKIELSSRCDTAINFSEKVNFFALPEFKNGFFEIQDEGSQLVCSYIYVHPKKIVLDYCCGSGGKSLAIAPKLLQQGQIFLHDIRSCALRQAKKRFKRAGVTNIQHLVNKKQKKRLKKKVDCLILDVPCSGSGTLRRNPNMKWKFHQNTIDHLIADQRKIFQEAFDYVKESGDIYYITCSIFKEENEQQIQYFLNHFPVSLQSQHSWFPEKNGMDGFFIAHLKKS